MKLLKACSTFFRGKFFILHPLLLAAFPVLFLYSQNISETAADQIFLPLVLSLAGTAVLWALLSLLMKNAVKAGIAASLFLVFFYSYGRLYSALEQWGVSIPGHAKLLPIALFICGYCIYFISIAKRDFRNTTRILNFIAAVLVIVNLFSIGWYQINKPSLSADNIAQNSSVTRPDSGSTMTKPDIYYIILDEYAHPDTMKEYYDYDNSAFIEYLEDKGFYWASESKTRTGNSERSMATGLNMDYVSDQEDEIVFQKIQKCIVSDVMGSLGYQYIYFGIVDAVDADIAYNFYEPSNRSVLTDEFSHILWNTTVLLPFYDYAVTKQVNTLFRSAIHNTLYTLKQIPDMRGPTFVFAHIMSPHEPFVFGPNGEFIYSQNWSNYKDKQYYLGQYIYITKEIRSVIDMLLDKSDPSPIIIIQSDHGLRTHHKDIQVGKTEWAKILNAYYLPGKADILPGKNISPANSFRYILNRYFGMNYELLEN